MSTTEISALLQLLLDEDQLIREAAAGRLQVLGEEGMGALRGASEGEDPHLRVRARALLQKIDADQVAVALGACLADPCPDLEEAAVLLARVEHPGLDPREIVQELDRLGSAVAVAVAACASPTERALALSRVLHDLEGFRGNGQDYYDPRNSYLDEVLRRRLGIPISLSAVWILAGRRAGLTLRGVGMPMHFLVSAEFEGETLLIDPYGGGRLLGRDACRALLAGFNHSFREEYLRPVSDRDMLRRMISNLVHVYHDKGDRIRLGRMLGFVNALQGSTT